MSESDEELHLLTSPIERRSVSRLFVIGGPVGLAIAIVLSLWVSQMRVTHAVIVQVEPQWVPGETLALRVQVTPESPRDPAPAKVDVEVEQDGQRFALTSPSPVEPGWLAQGRVTVPSLTPGLAVLHVHVEADPFVRDEQLPIEVVQTRAPVVAQHVVSGSLSQYADDSDEQPEAMAIDLRPMGRVLAGFENELLLRVTSPKGTPWSGSAALRLLDGEFGEQRGSGEEPPLLWEGKTDEAGLASVRGLLSSEVLRVRVELMAPDDPTTVLHQRKIRLVSFAGAVQLDAAPRQAKPGGTLEVLAGGLSAKRPVFVDVFAPDGSWVDTFDPPFLGREPAREWSDASAREGLLQLEAYHFTNEPGESTAVVRVLAQTEDGGDVGSLEPLLAMQRDKLAVPRADRTWDEDRERQYLAWLGGATLSPAAVASARRWVLGTLPIEVHGPPTLLRSRERDLAAMLDKKHRWVVGLRIFLMGGGGLFLLAMTVLMVRSHSEDAKATLEELQCLTEGDERERMEAHVRQARRGALLRGLLVVVSMAVGLFSAMLLLENLVWDF